MRDTDFTKFRERHIRRTDRTDTFDEALAHAVQIVEDEKFQHPQIEITPVWVYGEGQEGELYFDLVVSSALYVDSGVEV